LTRRGCGAMLPIDPVKFSKKDVIYSLAALAVGAACLWGMRAYVRTALVSAPEIVCRHDGCFPAQAQAALRADMRNRLNRHVLPYIRAKGLHRIDFLAIYTGGWVLRDPVFIVADGRVHYLELYRELNAQDLFADKVLLEAARRQPRLAQCLRRIGPQDVAMTPEIMKAVGEINAESLTMAPIFDAPVGMYVAFEGTRPLFGYLFTDAGDGAIGALKNSLILRLGGEVAAQFGLASQSVVHSPRKNASAMP